MNKKVRRLRFAPVVLLGTLTLTSCPVNPATGERQFILLSENQEIQMGQEYAKQVDSSLGLYDDADLQAYINEMGQKLAAQSERPNLPWSFKVVDDPVVNAFALPGGPIYVTRGILGYFNSEAELAAVLGHEIGHVTARHSAEQLSRAQFAQLGLGVGSIFVSEVAAASDLLGASLGLLFLKFGRDDERQADDLGLRYMMRGTYEPREMVDVFVMLGRVSEASGGSGLPGWLSTHPDPGERRQRIEAAIAAEGGSRGGTVARDRYLSQIDGVIFGENPRNGFFRGSLFLHPDLEFQIDFPDGWQTQNTPQAVAALSQDKDAAIQLTLSEESSANAAAESLLSQQGIRRGSSSRQPVNGLPARWDYFAVTTQDGKELRGLVVFIEYGGRVFQILGYTTAARMGNYDSVFQRSLGSFTRLTDREALNVQPRRIDIVTLDRGMTLEEFAQRYPSTGSLSTLALLNGVDEGATLAAGQKVKRVTGGVLPEGQ